MATIDDTLIDKGKGIVGATKDYGIREVKHQFWDKAYEWGAALVGAALGYAAVAYKSASRVFEYSSEALLSGFIGLSTFYTAAKLTSLPINIYKNFKSLFQYGRELIGGKKTEPQPSGPLQPAPAH